MPASSSGRLSATGSIRCWPRSPLAGRDRAEALARLGEALDETVVLGLTTNLRFLRWLVRQPVVLAGEVRIDTLERIWPPDDDPGVAGPPPEAWATAARLLGAAEDPLRDPWAGGWRIGAPARIRLATEGDVERTVEVPAAGRGPRERAVRTADGTVHVDVDGRSVPFRLAPPPDVDRALRAATHHGATVGDVDSPMPGIVLAVHASPGAAVEAGDALVTLEAMKMEHVVVAPGPGTVRELPVRVGDQVRRGQVVAILE